MSSVFRICVIGFLVLTAACGSEGDTSRREALIDNKTPQPRLVQDSSSDLSMDPYSLTWDRARKLFHPPDTLGYLKGMVVGEGKTVEALYGANVVPFTDFPYLVQAYLGPITAKAPYGIGSTITLRVPGAADATDWLDSTAPVVRNGMNLYVLVRDQGDIGGGNSKERVVVSIRGSDVFAILDDGTISNERPGSVGF